MIASWYSRSVALLSGDLLQGRYRVESPLGQGGMGAVFLAREEPSGATRVVKQLRVDAPELLSSFRGEFALLSRLSHPHLVRVLELGSERIRGEVIHYYVAEHIEGQTLAARAGTGASAPDLLRPLLDALEGLAVLHDARIRHGDFTPTNVLVRKDGSGVLIDLGCARPFGVTELLAGTEGYLAPELLERATGSAPADLFAVGHTIRTVWALAGLRPSDPVRQLVERVSRPDPERRPQEVAEVLEALGRRKKPQKWLFAPSELLGRETELAQFQRWLETFLTRSSGPRVLSIQGAAGVGATRFMRELGWRAQLSLPVLRVRVGEPAAWRQRLARALGLEALPSGARATLAAVRSQSERTEPLLVTVEDCDQLQADERESVLSIARLLGDSGSFAMVISSRKHANPLAAERIELAPLDIGCLRSWTRGALSERKLLELFTETQGLPVKIEAALRREARFAAQTPGHAKTAGSSSWGSGPQEVPLLAQLWVLGGEASLAELDENAVHEQAISTGSWIERDGESVRLSSEAREALESRPLPALEIARAHGVVAKRLARELEVSDDPAKVARYILHASGAGDVVLAEGALLKGEAAFRRRPRLLADALGQLLDQTQRADVLRLIAELLLAMGQPRRALHAAARLGRAATRAKSAIEPRLIATDALVRLGRPARAERLLARLIATKGDESPKAPVFERLARVKLQLGDYASAKQNASLGIALDPPARVAGLLHETLGVAETYAGDLDSAERALDRALELLGDAGDARELSRITSHRALVAFRQGRIERALTAYAAALALAEDHDHDDLVAVGLLNLGTAEQQAGQWANALLHYERGALVARAIGRITTELSLLFNQSNLYAELGAFERAEQGLGSLCARAEAAKLQQFAPAAALVRAEIHLAQSDFATARSELDRAEAELVSRHQPRELFEVRLRQADVALASGEVDAAAAQLAALTEAAPAQADLELGLEILRARVALLRGERAALSWLESAREHAERAGLRSTEATLLAELSRAAQRLLEPELAAKYAERARRAWDTIAAGLSSALGTLFWNHPRRAPLLELSRVFSPTAGSHAETETYRRLLSINRRLNSSLSVERVLEYAVQAAVDLTGAERGFLVLAAAGKGANRPPEIAVQRSTEPELSPNDGPSRNIVLRTLEREEAILTTDAQGDARFLGHGSVHALRLKSVLSVPILSPSGTLGVLYVDSRVQRARFSDQDRESLLAFADQLAIALGNARLHAELAQKTLELEQQKRDIERLSKGQAKEIQRLQREVSTQRQNLELRYDYSQIVGRSGAMRQVLERLDRVIDSDVSVLVLGESGTGKELVARAVHFNGSRKLGPFQGINCAALPESLLEAELFGSVKGAFTGADRDKIGLMPAANGGTLFLDEVGELPLSTQAKLLRVLQEREVRPLGANRAIALDIRLVCATHRDLLADVASGRFREDLYYRIAVVSVDLPPLRQRVEDLPALSTKILSELARRAHQPTPELTQSALRKLSAHAFPGNVRELQNVLTRAFVLASGGKIDERDIDLGATRARGPRAHSRRDFEAQERERILEALRSARWNVSVVARSLAIPRNTLYRKLARYGISRTAPEP